MMSVSEIIDDVIGRSFEIECADVVLRGRDDFIEPFFRGPGSISGGTNGVFTVRVHNTLKNDPKEIFKLWQNPPDLRFDATDYYNNPWTGAWFQPLIHGKSATRCWVLGRFPQLSVDVGLTAFDHFRNATVLYYAGDLRLPMLEVAEIERRRGSEVERVSTEWDQTELDFDGARVVVRVDAESGRTIASTTYAGNWCAPYCETGLGDALSFVCATDARPRVTVRFANDKAILFVRETPDGLSRGMPRPIAYRGPRDQAFWNVFLAFLRHFRANPDYFSTRLSRLFSELVSASSGTVHAFVLSLVLGIEDLVEQIVGCPKPVDEVSSLRNYIQAWEGSSELRDSAVKIISSLLSRTSTVKHLQELADKGVVTLEQIEVWKSFRPKLAHGKTINYEDENLWESRNQLIMTFHRLVLRLINYRGEISEMTRPPPDFSGGGPFNYKLLLLRAAA